MESRTSAIPLSEQRARASESSAPRGFKNSLVTSAQPVSLIAEVKKASPVKGLIRQNFDPVAIARSYEQAGAHCLSVLTDVEHFQGSPEFLQQCREATSIPVLRKDFIVSEYDIWESRALGADAILLIVCGLSKSQLKEFRHCGEELGMDVLVEAHSHEQAETALETGATFIGINNRDLETFKETIGTACGVIPLVKDRATVVSESAISNHDDVRTVSRAGARAVLIGTTFCKADDPGAKVKEVMGW